jgi:hypothetical protein
MGRIVPEDATWELYDDTVATYHQFYLKHKVPPPLNGGKDVINRVLQYTPNSTLTTSAYEAPIL